jgi:hypothetical protein
MPVLTYLVTAVAEHLSGVRCPKATLDELLSDSLAEAVRGTLSWLVTDDDEHADYRCEQVTVEPVDDVEQVALVLPRADVEAIVAAVELLTPPGDAGKERQPLLAALRLALVDPVDVERRPELTVIPGGGNPERWSDDDADS